MDPNVITHRFRKLITSDFSRRVILSFADSINLINYEKLLKQLRCIIDFVIIDHIIQIVICEKRNVVISRCGVVDGALIVGYG